VEYVGGGRDMGRGRGTVPRGMGAIVEAMVGVFGGRRMAGRLSDPGGGGEVGVVVVDVISEGMGLVWKVKEEWNEVRRDRKEGVGCWLSSEALLASRQLVQSVHQTELSQSDRAPNCHTITALVQHFNPYSPSGSILSHIASYVHMFIHLIFDARRQDGPINVVFNVQPPMGAHKRALNDMVNLQKTTLQVPPFIAASPSSPSVEAK